MDGKKEFLIKLLKNVKKRKELWDKTSEDYKKMQKKEIAWVEIAIEIGKSEDICRAAWKKLRSNFVKYLKTDKRYAYHDEMSFLIPHIRQTTKSGNAVPIVEISDSENYSSEEESHNLGSEKEIGINDENSISSSHYRQSITTTTNIHHDVMYEPEFDMKPNISILPDYPETVFVDEDNQQNEMNTLNDNIETNDEDKEQNDNNVSSAAVQSTSNGNTNLRKRTLPLKGKIKGNNNKRMQLSGSSSSNEDHPMLLFFKSVLPDVTSLPAHKQRLFRKHVLHVIDCLYADVPNPE